MICTLQPNGSLQERLNQLHVRLVHVPKKGGRDLTLPVRLARCMRLHRIDILHTHNWATLLEGMAASTLARVKVRVHGEHGRIYDRHRQIIAQRWVWRRATQVLSVSSALADRLAKSVCFPRDKIHVISNGVDTDRFYPVDQPTTIYRRQLGLPDKSLLIGMVARFIEFKDHAGLIRALALAGKERTNVHVVLAGEGPLESELKQLSNSLGLNNRVHFLGNIDQIGPLLHELDVLVSNSSRCEGMSNAVLEAMASGLPVIATHVAASPELLDNGTAGLLIPPSDKPALVEALEKLIDNPSLRLRYGQSARARAVDKFSVSSMIDSYADLYRRLARSVSIEKENLIAGSN